ncbi:nucleotidyltransferase family protein [Hoeflea sp. YIM 152468]|uniref:nucleotidyltransferase family protein n=1 Tax=Hoeflea sp. YIM 152468 TaxID=3031759 RepID=UPI0023DA3ECF|nr:nucleotidyltransferase family protein [Hoeflea sp. YIM 152468]MDF1606872.1 nucleotidyltransferase family protein [Hoeflea sp. YIM 152468]
MYNTAAIVLAAGLSRRMGTVNKLLVDIRGTPMIRATVSACAAVCDAPVTVVTGYQAAEIEQALAGLTIELVHNPEFASGQASSVVKGLNAAPEAKTTLVVLGDQPLLDGGALERLLQAHRASDQTRITLPVNGDDRGNPLVIPLALKAALLADKTDPGCRKFTRDNPGMVNPVPFQDPAYFTDLDTPDDLEFFQTGPPR